jgi:arsenite methyltransferase
VAGALAERDFVAKMDRAGFVDVEIVSREDRSIDDFALYPLFTDELIAMMRALIPAEQHHAVATAVVIKACLGGNGQGLR